MAVPDSLERQTLPHQSGQRDKLRLNRTRNRLRLAPHLAIVLVGIYHRLVRAYNQILLLGDGDGNDVEAVGCQC